MLDEIMRDINNHFARDRATDELFGYESNKYEIIDDTIAVWNKYVVGQFIAIVGSVLNDGVYEITDCYNGIIVVSPLPVADEIFEGTIFSLRVPREFLELAKEIDAFSQSRDGQASNIISASFGIQSQSFGTDANGVRAGWQTVFRQKLHKYRRHTPDVVI